MSCRICGNEINNCTYLVPEMMFGFKEKFNYIACGQCGCLQIETVPADLSKYYPAEYYSFAPPRMPRGAQRFFEDVIRRARARYVLTGRGFFGKIIARQWPPRAIYRWLTQVKATFVSRILDVGAGNGTLVCSLYRDGFKNIVGSDPYIKETIQFQNGPIIFKSELAALPGPFNMVMMHHSLEHMPDQIGVLKEVYRLLNPGGYVLIRIPTVSSANWRRFGTYWANLDAPRHLFLHSRKSIKLIARKAGFAIVSISDDATPFGISGSLQYERGIPLRGSQTVTEIFTEEERREFKRQTKLQNVQHEGDQIAIILNKPV